MLILRFAIIPLSIGLFTPMMYCFVKKQNIKKESKMRNDEFVIMNSPVFCYLIIFCEIIYATILILLNLFDKINFVQDIICIIVLIMFAAFVIALIREKVFVNDNKIKVVPAFGKTKQLTFMDIDYIKITATSRGLVSYKVYKNKSRIFSFSNVYIGAKLFIDSAKRFNTKIEME